MDYLKRPRIIPDNRAVMTRQYNLATFFGKLKEPAGEQEGIVMGPSEINNLLDSFTPPKGRLSIDQILECNDQEETWYAKRE